MYYGDKDWMTAPEDLAKTLGQLNPDFLVHERREETYGHMDFSWGIDLATGGASETYIDLLDVLSQHA